MPRADLHARGKVRDIFEAGDGLLMVATDRISAFDVVLPQAIPDKGRVLTGLSLYWFDRTSHLVANHLITADVAKFPEPSAPDREWLAGRAMLVRRADVVPIECVARGYLSGAGWASRRGSWSPTGCPSRSSRPPRRKRPGTTSTSRSTRRPSAWGAAWPNG